MMSSSKFIPSIFLVLFILYLHPTTILSRSSRACKRESVNETLDITHINSACRPRTVTTYSCRGWCSSYSNPVAITGGFEKTCKCCSVRRSVQEVVTFSGCKNVLRRQLIKSCRCLDCT